MKAGDAKPKVKATCIAWSMSIRVMSGRTSSTHLVVGTRGCRRLTGRIRSIPSEVPSLSEVRERLVEEQATADAMQAEAEAERKIREVVVKGVVDSVLDPHLLACSEARRLREKCLRRRESFRQTSLWCVTSLP